MSVAELLLFVLWANALPFLAHLFLGHRLELPVDGGLRGPDGRPLLGPNKTWRGLVASLAGSAAVAPLLGLPLWLGAAGGLAAMLGDLATSFIKRRLGRPSGAPMLGLDQALEAALPLLLLAWVLSLPAWTAVLAWLVFVPLGHAASRYWYYMLYRPPRDNYPRIVRTTTRLREWRACHLPLARWQRWFNFENYVYYRVVLTALFKGVGWYRRGVDNTLAVQVRPVTLCFPDLPPAFDGFRLLLFTDLHLDGLPPLTDALIERTTGLEVDLCLIGGDVRMEVYGPMAPAIRLLRRLVAGLHGREGVYGVLGNHDCIEFLPDLEESGVTMLVNDAVKIERDGQELWLVGVDDPHYYRCHDLEQAYAAVPAGAFSVLLAHSPELYAEAPAFGARLYLCGHTHGGQICLPGIGPVFTHSSAPRFTAAGEWRHDGMTGYTSRGAGASGIPLRFNCPGEVSLIELRRGEPGMRDAAARPA